MKRFFAVLPLLVLLVLPSPAFAKISDTYIGGKISYSSISPEATINAKFGSFDYEDDDYSGVGIGFVYGFTITKMSAVNLRFEFETLIRFGSNEMETTKGVDSTIEIHTNSSLLGGLYLDFPITDSLSPYVGVLLGANIFGCDEKTKIVGGTYDETNIGVAFQYGIGGGVNFKFSPRMSIDLGARYLLTTDANIDKSDTDWDIDINHNILDVSLGFRYYF